MIETGLFFLFLAVWCLLFAKLEAEIEGPNGWAVALPTARYMRSGSEIRYRPFNGSNVNWQRVNPNSLKGKFIKAYINVLGGKDFTVYHRVVDLIQLFVAHILVYLCFKGLDPWWILEIRAFATLMLIWSIEDTLWFYVNPCASESRHHKDWIMIGNKRIMEKGMSVNFIAGTIIMVLSFFLIDLWHLIF